MILCIIYLLNEVIGVGTIYWDIIFFNMSPMGLLGQHGKATGKSLGFLAFAILLIKNAVLSFI
jgi:hypothetical protein